MSRCPPSHDVFDAVWNLLELHLPGRAGVRGGKAGDNRLFINAVSVFRNFRTGALWRNLPSDYGDWKNTHRRFCRWLDRGVWEGLLKQPVTELDFERLMIDASHIKVHPHAAGAQGGNLLAQEALQRIAVLYAIEAEGSDLTPNERQALRAEKSLPLLSALHDGLQQTRLTTAPNKQRHRQSD